MQVCDRDGLLQNFQSSFGPRPPTGCDVSHMFYGRSGFDGGTIGCAFIGAICNFESYAVNHVGFNSAKNLQAVLVAHELGHNLAGKFVSY